MLKDLIKERSKERRILRLLKDEEILPTLSSVISPSLKSSEQKNQIY